MSSERLVERLCFPVAVEGSEHVQGMKALGEEFRDIADPTECVAQCDKARIVMLVYACQACAL